MTTGFSKSPLFAHLKAILIFETKKVIILYYFETFFEICITYFDLFTRFKNIYGYTFSDFCNNHQQTNCEMLKKKLNILTKSEETPTKTGNPYYLVLFENHTKPGIVLGETVVSGDPLYTCVMSKDIIVQDFRVK